jgi:ribosome recycling factor
MSDSYNNEQEKMKKTLEVLLHEFDSIRAGRANAAVLERLRVEYYGAQSPIEQVASISIPEPRVLVIQPWDGSLLKEIEKAILTSDIGINPQNDGKVIRLTFPQLTEERRRDLVKQVHKYSEEGKVAVRNIRRDALDHYKAMKKKSEITEDDLKDIEKDILDLTEKYCKKIDEMAAHKEKELLEV